jgi:hypothetical protein
MTLSISHHRRYRCFLSIALLAFSLSSSSSYYGCEGFSTTTRNTLAFSSSPNTKTRTISSDGRLLSSIPRRYRQPVYCSRTKTPTRTSSLFCSSNNNNNENNNENSDSYSVLSSSSSFKKNKNKSILFPFTFVTSIIAKIRWSKQFISDVQYGSLMVHQNYLELFWNIIVKKTLICTLPVVVILLIFPCWEPTMKIAKFTHHLLIGTLTPIAIFFTKFVSIILLPFDIAILLLLDPVYMWKFILNLPNKLLGIATAKGITRGHDLLPGLSQRSLHIYAVIVGPIIEEIIFRLGFYKLWQSTVGRILMRKDTEGNKTDDADNNTPSSSS